MTRLRTRLVRGMTAFCLLVQGAAFLWAGRWTEAPRLPSSFPVALPGLLLVVLAGLWWRARRGHRTAPALLLAGQLGLLLVAGFSRQYAGTDPLRWTEEQRPLLSAMAGAAEDRCRILTADLDSLAAMAGGLTAPDPFGRLAELARIWRLRYASVGPPLGLALWRDDERLAWSAELVPLPAPRWQAAGVVERRLLTSVRDRWLWRRFQTLDLGDGQPAVLELQLSVAEAAGTDASEGGNFTGSVAAPQVRLGVVPAPGLRQERWWGDAELGLELTRDLDLDDTTPDGEQARIRITVQSPPLRLHQHRDAARFFLLFVAFWGLAAVAWGTTTAGGLGLLGGLWATRLLLLGVDIFRWVQPAWPGQRLPALPGELASLVDPAYFATPFAGGWLASTADALLSAALLAATAWVVMRRLEGPESGAAEPAARPSPRPWLALLFGLLSGLVLLLVRALVWEIVANANAHLIGAQVPLGSLSFWVLHLVLLLVSGSLAVLLTALAVRWRRRTFSWPASVLVLAGALLTALAAPGLTLAVRAILVLATLLLWGSAPLLRARAFPLHRLAFLPPLLVTVLWNYTALSEAYGRTEQAWLEHKAEQVVISQAEWVRFLLADVLTEMATSEPLPAKPSAPEAAELWRNRAAYDLWWNSAVHDLGLPCLVEILDGDGFSESLFASGFFRDFGYEVLARSEWEEVGAAGQLGAGEGEVAVQAETRRYPTGEEWLLRGEVSRQLAAGWIRLELPVRSKRITTLITRLVGLPAEPGRGGYRPRAEVERPLLLVRGDAAGWLDAGPGNFPDPGANAVVEALKEGKREWGLVRAGGASFLSLWRTLPADAAATDGEGFLIGLQQSSLLEVLLDLSRLLLLDLLLLAPLGILVLLVRLLRGRSSVLNLGFQERFLAGYLALGLLLLLLAGTFVDRLNQRRLEREAREQTRDGLTAGWAQLQGLLTEQARALAESDYIADLLVGRLAGQRPLGPFSARQAMVFAGDGTLLLDETLSDLDAAEAAMLLATGRAAPLVVMDDGGELYLGIVIPIDLSGVLEAAGSTQEGGTDSTAAGRHPAREQDGFFFYRQRMDGDLLAGLAEIVQGEVTLRYGGEAVLTSHPERVFSGLTPLVTPPDMVRPLLERPFNPFLWSAPGTRLSFTGCVGLPALVLGEARPLRLGDTPAVLAATFPARELEFATQREQTVLFLAGLASLILLTAALLALLLTWNIFGPVRMLVTATRHLAAGDFAAPLPEPGRDEVGTLAAAFGGMRDDLQRTQAALAERERFLSTVLNRVSVGVAVFAADDAVVALNPAGEEILAAYGQGEPTASPERARSLLAGFRSLIGPATQGEAEMHSADGRRTLRGRLAPLLLPDGRRDTMIVFEDVTEFLANKRLALNAELARQVAHEIKNPLTPIQLSVQLLRQAYEDRSPDLDRIVQDTVRQVLDQVTLLRSIASEFSLLGRPGDLVCSELDLAALVRKVVASYQAGGPGQPEVGPRVEVAAEPVPRVLGHAESLIKVLGNLMENSLDASGGPAELQLRVGWQVDVSTVTLLWEDNGPGLPADVVERLFDPYFSTKSRGTGLGLAICRNLLDKMGGTIALANREDGGGTVARVSLPRADSAGAISPRHED
jgi:signal transduction histidine kinase/HAMP domain-containing protein